MAQKYAYGRIDDSRALAKLQRAYRKAVKANWISTRQLVTLGVNIAKQLTPYDTGQTYQAIKGSTERTRSGGRGRIFIQTKPRLGEKLTTDQLVGVMHRWSGSQSHFRTGDPQFMYTTRALLESVGKRTVRGTYKSINFNN